MITILLGSLLIAYVSFPLYGRIVKKISNKPFSIILSLLIIVIIILIPFAFLAIEITQQGSLFYNSLSNNIAKGALLGFGCTSEDSRVCLILNQAEKFSLERLSKFGFDKQLKEVLPIIEEKITKFILGIPLIIGKFFLMLVLSFFILMEWKSILKKMVDLVPMRTKTKEKLIKQFGNVAYTVIYAQLFVALVQGIVATIGFYIAGIPFPVFFGVVVAFCALIPAIGTSIIWIPASLYLILSGYFSHSLLILVKGLGLFLYGIMIISTIDNILLATIVHAKAKVSQITIIVGVIGGASMFGVVGIFIGPILLALLITYFETFKERFV
jgi:predicted PurR-regulated permease PerM